MGACTKCGSAMKKRNKRWKCKRHGPAGQEGDKDDRNLQTRIANPGGTASRPGPPGLEGVRCLPQGNGPIRNRAFAI